MLKGQMIKVNMFDILMELGEGLYINTQQRFTNKLQPIKPVS